MNWIKSIPLVKHITEQPFVFSTGLAALMHSTWSLGMLFAGEPPKDITSLAGAGWLIPAFLIAFALDVGQIYTSYEIRSGQREIAKYITFMVFALATYYLQWMYCLHHMPELSIAAGISDIHKPQVVALRDFAIWIIPAFLPLSTLLYTFAAHHEEKPALVASVEELSSQIIMPVFESLPDHFEQEVAELSTGSGVTDPTLFNASCPHCEWEKQYDTKQKASSAMSAHLARCKYAFEPSTNGHK